MDNGAKVYYHRTCIVSFNKTHIMLDTGGWWTVTTKLRMNQASNQFDLGFRVYQKEGVWYVSYYKWKKDKKFCGYDLCFRR
jgi:hypothetical protein